MDFVLYKQFNPPPTDFGEEEEEMKISFTGTFDVPRKKLEKKIKRKGVDIVDFSGKTEVLLVGEKTASPKKIAKAEGMGIKIIRETDFQKIIPIIYGEGEAVEKGFETYHDSSCNGVIAVGEKIVLFDDGDDLAPVHVFDEGKWKAYIPNKPFERDYSLIDADSGDAVPEWVNTSFKNTHITKEKPTSELPTWVTEKIREEFPDFEFEEEEDEEDG